MKEEEDAHENERAQQEGGDEASVTERRDGAALTEMRASPNFITGLQLIRPPAPKGGAGRRVFNLRLVLRV